MQPSDGSVGTDRLTEFLASEHARLKLYLGVAAFTMVGRRYAAKYPIDTPNSRWFSRHLAKFLGETPPYSRNPELAELAKLEAALNAAFMAPEAPIWTARDLAELGIEDLAGSIILIHPSVQRLRFATNTTSLWAAMTCEQTPPRPERLDEPSELVVWRQGPAARFRMLGEEEAHALDAAMAGNHEGISQGAVAYLPGWAEAQIISAVRKNRMTGKK